MSSAAPVVEARHEAVEIRLHGHVQGVGMRPFIYRLAQSLGLHGNVCNDHRGVLVHVSGDEAEIQQFTATLENQVPVAARIDRITVEPTSIAFDDYQEFEILPASTEHCDDEPAIGELSIPEDKGICAECLAEIRDPLGRRFRYALNTCVDCGPRYSMLQRMPFERQNSAMSSFTPCKQCEAEYASPSDRRFHMQGIACHVCGPAVHLARMDERAFSIEQFTHLDAVDAAATLIQRGEIVAFQGLGGFHLLGDATNADVVAKLRQRKRRPGKPLAVMVRDIDVLAGYASYEPAELAALTSDAAPIVLLKHSVVLEGIAPGLMETGFLLPYTGLHHLLLRRIDKPVVMTSANVSGNPQCLSMEEVRRDLSEVADWILWHDRKIENRNDDSLLRLRNGKTQLLRRARGFAPKTLLLPEGFSTAPAVLAAGGHLKNTLCFLQNGHAVMSPHIGDLDSPAMRESWHSTLQTMSGMLNFKAQVFAVDSHPEYASTQLMEKLVMGDVAGEVQLSRIQHHHAHAAACMAENGRALSASPVLAIVMDGLGYAPTENKPGENQSAEWWGGEFLLTDYYAAQRLASLTPVAMPGGEVALREPWRNLLAQIEHSIGWQEFLSLWPTLVELTNLQQRPVKPILGMLKAETNSPLASSAGRLFDAVACALGLPQQVGDRCMDGRLSFEGEAAMQLEALAAQCEQPVAGYKFDSQLDSITRLNPAPMWSALFDDLAAGRDKCEIAYAFHAGFADAMLAITQQLFAQDNGWSEATVVLSGGVFQNSLLSRLLSAGLDLAGFQVLEHHQYPANDGGLSLGQAVVAAAQAMQSQSLGQHRRRTH